MTIQYYNNKEAKFLQCKTNWNTRGEYKMSKITIAVGADFNTGSVAEEIMHNLEEEGYDLRVIDVSTSGQEIEIVTDIVRFDQNILEVISGASDGYRTGIVIE